MLERIIDDKMNEILGNEMEKRGIDEGNITPAQGLKWDSLVEEMNELMEEIMEQNRKAKIQIELPQVYVFEMLSALNVIKNHNLYELMNLGDDEKWKLDAIIDDFLEPLSMITDDDGDVIVGFYN